MTQTPQTVSETLTAHLARFRQTHPLQTAMLDGHEWRYYAAGSPDQTALLLLPGGGGDAESLFRYIDGFAEQFRVIAPDVPPQIPEAGQVVEGLRALLAHEGVEKTHVVGLSWGAMLAQLYIRRFQETVSDLVLTHTVIPSDHLAETVRMQQQLMALYPAPLLLWLSRRAFLKGIANSTAPIRPAERKFWQEYVDGKYRERMSKAQLVARARLSADYHANYQFKANDLNHWYGDLLIIESDGDDVIGDGDRGALLGMYPRAFVQTMVGYDHLAPLLAADRLVVSIRKFLLKNDEETR